MGRFIYLITSLFIVIVNTTYAKEINYSNCASLQDVIEQETQAIKNTNAAQHRELAHLHMLRAGSYTLAGASAEALYDTQVAYSHGRKCNPALSLNSMDVPFFQQDDNPLKDMGSFAVVLLMRFDSPEIRKKADALIEKELSNFGKIIRADQKRIDLRGIGSRNFLILDSGEVKNSEEKLLPISRVSLRIQTPVTLTKTGINTSTNVWSINDFVDSSSGAHSDDKMLNALQKLLGKFKSNYTFVNSGRVEKPSFYLYY